MTLASLALGNVDSACQCRGSSVLRFWFCFRRRLWPVPGSCFPSRRLACWQLPLDSTGHASAAVPPCVWTSRLKREGASRCSERKRACLAAASQPQAHAACESWARGAMPIGQRAGRSCPILSLLLVIRAAFSRSCSSGCGVVGGLWLACSQPAAACSVCCWRRRGFLFSFSFYFGARRQPEPSGGWRCRQRQAAWTDRPITTSNAMGLAAVDRPSERKTRTRVAHVPMSHWRV